jgi:hypothetical protein
MKDRQPDIAAASITLSASSECPQIHPPPSRHVAALTRVHVPQGDE